MRPDDLPSADHYAHGTRARYVTGCRCDPCRASNRATYHEKQRRGLEAAAAIAPAPATPLVGKGGRTYKRACPGVNGAPCAAGSYLRKDSKAVCGRCRDRLSFNGLVDATPARRHLRRLSRAGVGRDSVSAASDVGVTVLSEILRGEKLRVRAETERRILAVTAAARADHALVPAAPTWKLIGKLIDRGFKRSWIARQLGQRGPALQVRRDHVIATTELSVRRLFEKYRHQDPPERPRRAAAVVACSCDRPMVLRDLCARCERPLRAEKTRLRRADTASVAPGSAVAHTPQVLAVAPAGLRTRPGVRPPPTPTT